MKADLEEHLGDWDSESGTKICTICNYEISCSHSFGEYISNDDATTTADGTKSRICNICGFKETVADTGSKIHIHTYSEGWTCDEEYHWHAVTCEHTSEPVVYINHDWNIGEVTKNPTVTEEGIYTYTCKTCKYTRTSVIEKLTLSSMEQDIQSIIDGDLFYFSYEKSFDLQNRFHYIVKLTSEEGVLFEADLAEMGLITTDCTPKELFDNNNFIYEVPLKYNSEDTMINGIDITEVIKIINSTKIKVFIAVRGDVNTDFDVDGIDASNTLTYYAYYSGNSGTEAIDYFIEQYKTIFQTKLNCNEVTQLMNKYLWKYIDVDCNKKIEAVDASGILFFYSYKVGEYADLSTEELWKKVFPNLN
ncbi:MAG: hypothetical protein MJ160_00085 [Treponema sp.]|nr:hypothetical protein [Treponema sp.]